MRQWIGAIEGKMVGTELETFAAFFVCVWMVPIIFSLCLDVCAESFDSLELELAPISGVDGTLDRDLRKDCIVYLIDTVLLPQLPTIRISFRPPDLEPNPFSCA